MVEGINLKSFFDTTDPIMSEFNFKYHNTGRLKYTSPSFTWKKTDFLKTNIFL